MSDDFVNYRLTFEKPTLPLAKLLARSINGDIVSKNDYLPFFLRAQVYAIDLEGGRLEGPNVDVSSSFNQTYFDDQGQEKTHVVKPVKYGSPNPPDSIQAKILDQKYSISGQLRIFWPLFPGLFNPAPGELVYVLFEDAAMDRGLWIAKVPVSNEFAGPKRTQLNDITPRTQNDRSLNGTVFGDSAQQEPRSPFDYPTNDT